MFLNNLFMEPKVYCCCCSCFINYFLLLFFFYLNNNHNHHRLSQSFVSMLFFLFCYLTIRWCCFDFALVTLFNWRFSIHISYTDIKNKNGLASQIEKQKKSLQSYLYYVVDHCVSSDDHLMVDTTKKKKFKMQMNKTKTKTILEHYKFIHDSRLNFFSSSFSYIFFVCLNWTCSPVWCAVLNIENWWYFFSSSRCPRIYSDDDDDDNLTTVDKYTGISVFFSSSLLNIVIL